ncbi:hypothetical protein B0T11DRAFT_294382 [Plectosphaerella cucumerina]|uniref:Uncharacterized protein n=1 Tax=Plectosphaerella cucumerina TaxID=40658 RepID=A0A8K0TR39_9PEZI|nr:hypothetical protein B0T11DRAFT_294382 [Plectosphaerella cucumerina]
MQYFWPISDSRILRRPPACRRDNVSLQGETPNRELCKAARPSPPRPAEMLYNLRRRRRHSTGGGAPGPVEKPLYVSRAGYITLALLGACPPIAWRPQSCDHDAMAGAAMTILFGSPRPTMLRRVVSRRLFTRQGLDLPRVEAVKLTFLSLVPRIATSVPVHCVQPKSAPPRTSHAFRPGAKFANFTTFAAKGGAVQVYNFCSKTPHLPLIGASDNPAQAQSYGPPSPGEGVCLKSLAASAAPVPGAMPDQGCARPSTGPS